MDQSILINVVVNGVSLQKQVEPRIHLIDFLRDTLQIKTARVSCEHGVCGACTVRVDGEIVRGCLMLAVQTDGQHIETIDGASDRGDLTALQEAFHARNAAQCGFCTPGMLLTASALLREKPLADREQVREYISGNYCRCTGYHAIVDAICDVLQAQRDARLD
ncbi:(2Fe-2S)-binding protein [Bordetella tumulicola]|uniref:(2Fe-2S)-binding protein n=1 Tax=Bordetella tumulicola TaxID=1649133 RepID=UPI0039EE1D80